MNNAVRSLISATTYDRSACKIGMVHVGFGAFHRAHQAVYLDDYMDATGDLNWGIAAVNLRSTETGVFNEAANDVESHDGYYLKSFSADKNIEIRRVRSHVAFADWSVDAEAAQDIIASEDTKLITITVTESGYYTDPDGNLDVNAGSIAAEIAGTSLQTIYGYLRAALNSRLVKNGAPITIACCDNIRQNGKMLKRNLVAYLDACDDQALKSWILENAAFPCSMVDRITPRSSEQLSEDLTSLVGVPVKSPVMAEDFAQWVLEDAAAAEMPDLAKVGVTITPDVDPFEETKIRVLNGGHTALAYLAALEGIETFDQAMRVPHLLEHFDNFEKTEVLPAITIDLPFSKETYLDSVRKRFGNEAIGDTVARICADGMAKFPIFIRPTLEGCLKQGKIPVFALRSIASWHQFACHVAAGKVPFKYVEPAWAQLETMLGNDSFVTSTQLWGDLPTTYPEFAEALRNELSEMELKWPV